MKKSLSLTLFSFASLTIIALNASAQMNGLHGEQEELKLNVFSGNQIRTSFYNDGHLGGRIGNLPEIAGEWPIYSAHYYLVHGSFHIGSEVIDTSGWLIHIISETLEEYIAGGIHGSPPVDWMKILPLPGFNNPNNAEVAMSHKPGSWPPLWPDIADLANPRYSPDGWSGAWNGYFGKDRFNADQECYFVADDYMNQEFRFYPDSTDLSRGGLGMRIYVRGFQWSYPPVENVLFMVYDIENIGTHYHDKMVLGYKISNNMGEDMNGSDSGDDWSSAQPELNLTYMWDGDNTGADGWSPVGYFGVALLETPGIPYDGIDNDNDGHAYGGPTITEAMFDTITLNVDDYIVIINYDTYDREVTTLSAALNAQGKGLGDTLEIIYNEYVYKYWAGKKIFELGNNVFDDNLNGLIDENRGVTIDSIDVYLYIVDGQGCKYINYFTSEGLDNPMIDERRDDDIDNDGDWDPLTDDTGTDGLLPGHPTYPGPDAGEGDGIPSTGEPNFDQTDIDEGDMIGLTSSNYYEWSSLNLYDDQAFWEALIPGYFSFDMTGQNMNLLVGSGYFSMQPDQIERLSIGFMLGNDLSALLETRENAAFAYNSNYRLPERPDISNLSATVIEKKVILTWDNLAELTYDAISGEDFEGYRIYKTMAMCEFTDPPIAQFDLDNEYSGYTNIGGESFYLGNNTGLKHAFMDTNIIYGHDYFYAVVSYDHGDSSLGITPLESIAGGAILSNGNISVGPNVVTVRPVDPNGVKHETTVDLVSGVCDGWIECEIVDIPAVLINHTYRLTFEDSLRGSMFPATNNYTLVDITENDTLVKRDSILYKPYHSALADGFRLILHNAGYGELAPIEELSGWNREGISEYEFKPYSYRDQPVQPLTGDYQIIFGKVGMDTSTSYIRGSTELPPIPVNFTILNTTSNEQVDFAFRQRDGEDGIFSFGNNRTDEIIFLADPDSQIASWWVRYILDSPVQTDTSIARAGDTLSIKLYKPFLSDNVFEFTMPDVTKIPDSDLLPEKLILYQNYPNPFNPLTTIEYQIGTIYESPVQVDINVYNILGQKIKTLVSGYKTAGEHRIDWDASNFASGVYLYRLTIDNKHSDTKKLILLK